MDEPNGAERSGGNALAHIHDVGASSKVGWGENRNVTIDIIFKGRNDGIPHIFIKIGFDGLSE